MNTIASNIGDDYINYKPPKPEDFDGKGKTLLQVPVQENMGMVGFDTLPPKEDKYRGKMYQWIAGELIGEQVRAEVTIKKNDKYFVLLETGQEIPLGNFHKNLVEVEIFEDAGSINPNEYNNGNISSGIKKNQPISVPPSKFDPVIEILKKKKKKPQKINIELELDIPAKELYILLVEGYEDGEDKIIDYLFTDENMRIMKQSIKESIRRFYRIVVDTSKDNFDELNDNLLKIKSEETEGKK